MKERIRNLLASGMKPADVASTVGCSPGYVSQLWKDEEFKKSVEALAVADAGEKSEEEHLDKRYQNLEHKIINNIESELGNAELPALTRALEVVAKRQNERRKEKLPVTPTTQQIANIHVTNISLPAHALARPAPIVQVNEQNEIIAIDNKPLSPMSSDGVKNIFQQIRERNAATKAAQAIPANIVAEL